MLSIHLQTTIVPLLSLIMLLGSPLAPVNIIGPILIGFCIYLYIIIDAIRTARRLGDTYQRKGYNKWYIYLGAYVIVWFVVNPAVAHLYRQELVQAFKVPSGPMEQTLLIGDHFLVNKFLYRSTPPKRFDIVVFKYPWEDQRDFVKRIVALPGDCVQIRDRQVYVNDQPLKEPYARYTALRSRPDDFGPLVVPKKGDQVEIRRDQRLYLNGKPVPIPSGPFYPRDHGAAMTGFEVFYGALFPAGTTLQKPTGPLVVQYNYYFTTLPWVITAIIAKTVGIGGLCNATGSKGKLRSSIGRGIGIGGCGSMCDGRELVNRCSRVNEKSY